MNQFNENIFIKKYVTERSASFFATDIFDNKAIISDAVQGKNILVIGGAGTIGSSYVKQILRYAPKSITIVDYNENGLTELTRDLRANPEYRIPSTYLTYPFDFGSPIMEKLLKSNSYDIVACFAAHKHVRSEKDPYAIEAMITNNVINTYRLLTYLEAKPPQHFFSVSTDKAANPVNVMGATKKMMENVLFAFSQKFKITTARFANVAFSNGSLLYGFKKRLEKRQPLSGPSDVKRYFVSPEESGELCLIASLLGDNGDIFFPKLKTEQMKTFSSIADDFLKAQGYTNIIYCKSEAEAKTIIKELKDTNTYPVYYSASNTSGEKMYEEFFEVSDKLDLERFVNIGMIKQTKKTSREEVEVMIKEIMSFFENKYISKESIIKLLNKYIIDFNHIEKGENLDNKM